MTDIYKATETAPATNRAEHQKRWGWPMMLTGFLLLAALLSLIAGLVPSAIAYAIAALMTWSKPFDINRAVNKPTLSHNGRIIVGIVAALAGAGLGPKSPAPTAPLTSPVASVGPVKKATAGIATNIDYAVRESAPLRTSPDRAAEQLSIPMGSDGTMTPISLDQSMQVRELQKVGKWSEIRVLQLPSDIGKAQGWVETAMLRPVKRDAKGRRIYEVKDFEWYGDSARYKDAFVKVANKVMAYNPNCDAINTQSVLIDRDRLGPTMKLLCYGQSEQAIDFRPADATNGRSFVPAAPVVAISQESAEASCGVAAKERAVHPSTVDVSIANGGYKVLGGGSAKYRTTFTAKNSFGLELNYDIMCSFKGEEFTNVEISEDAD